MARVVADGDDAADAVAATPKKGVAGLTHEPTSLERECDPADLQVIRDLYGSRAQTLINALLSFDGYFAWYYPLKNDCPEFGLEPDEAEKAKRLELMFTNTCSAIDMHEIMERISIRSHGSYLFHGAIFKLSRDIDLVGDVWACGTASLEMQNAETKRVADSGGSRRLTTSNAGVSRKPMRGSHEGPAQLVVTKGYNTTMVISTLNKLLALEYLRQTAVPERLLFATPPRAAPRRAAPRRAAPCCPAARRPAHAISLLAPWQAW